MELVRVVAAFWVSAALGGSAFLPSDRKSFASSRAPSSTPSTSPLFPFCINLN